jgi:phenylpropionate dioxygenase-like ring-hydroxylating dioxygenase large terminal subunit
MTTISPKPIKLPPKHFSEAPGARLPTEITMTAEEALLPTDRYLRRDVYDREVTGLWSRVWQVACRVDDLPQPGAYLEYTTADQSFLVVRGRDDQIRAFHNVCRHRGTQLKCGRGKAREIRCPFHSWTWSLEGVLDHIPDEDSFTALDLTRYGLLEVPTGFWAGFVFLNPDEASAEAMPLEEFLAPINEHLEGYHLEKMVALSDVSAPVAANWKTLTEAFLESYHPHAVHPQILPSTDDKNTVYELLGRHSRMLSRMGVPSPRLGSDLNPLESIAYLPNLFGGPSAREFDPTYASSSLRHLVDPYENTDGEIELPPGMAVPDLVASLLAAYLDEDGHLALPSGWSGRDVLIEMIGAFVADAGYLRLPVDGSPRDLFIDMTSALAVAQGRDYQALTRDQVLDDWHYFIFPNLVLNIQAGGFLFTRFRPDGFDHERSWFDAIRFVWPNEAERASIRPAPHVEVAEDERDVFGPVLSQDLEFVPRVQRGMHSKALRVISVGQQETRIPQFHKTIDSYLEGGLGV